MHCGFFRLFCILLTIRGFGQTVPADSAFVASAAGNALTNYNQLGTDKERLINGVEYIAHNPRLRVHPYFESDTWQPSLVRDDENGVVTLPILYDIVRDVVVIEHNTGYRVALRSDRIQSFSLLSHTFIRVSDSASRGFQTGFYDLLYNGPTQLLARRIKTILLNTSANIGEYGVFDPKTTYYVRRDGRYHPVKNKRTLLTVLDDRRKQLNAYARKQKLRFRPDREADIIKLTQYYDALAHSL